jgi:hypothetical protein
MNKGKGGNSKKSKSPAKKKPKTNATVNKKKQINQNLLQDYSSSTE